MYALKEKTDYASKVKLQQLLLALDGMFSRTQNVRGTNENNKYQLQYGAESNKNTFNQITTDILTNHQGKIVTLSLIENPQSTSRDITIWRIYIHTERRGWNKCLIR